MNQPKWVPWKDGETPEICLGDRVKVPAGTPFYNVHNERSMTTEDRVHTIEGKHKTKTESLIFWGVDNYMWEGTDIHNVLVLEETKGATDTLTLDIKTDGPFCHFERNDQCPGLNPGFPSRCLPDKCRYFDTGTSSFRPRNETDPTKICRHPECIRRATKAF